MNGPLLDEAGIADLRAAFDAYTVDTVQDAVGLVGRSAFDRGDLTGVARSLRKDRSSLPR